MARPATGQIVEHHGKDGRIYRSLRFRASGKRHTLPLGVVARDEAERQLAYVMADVARGVWRSRTGWSTHRSSEIPTLHEFAEQWWLRVEGQLSGRTRSSTTAGGWRATCSRLLRRETRVDAITFDTVERYIAAKLTRMIRSRRGRST